MTSEEAVKFFYDHAGYSFNPAIETEKEGRERCAQELAAAEDRLKNGPYYIDVVPEFEKWDGDVPYDGPLWIVDLRTVVGSTGSEIIGSLGMVAAESEEDPYIRVVAAQLAAEHIPAEV